jgi:hypothetical protein
MEDPVIDDGEKYDGNDEKLKKTVTVPNGVFLVSLVKEPKLSGEYGIKAEYKFGSGGYCGHQRFFPSANWRGGKGISFWILPDGTDNRLVVQFKEANNEYWEYSWYMKSNNPVKLEIPFADFRQPSWGGKIDGKLDLSAIDEFSIYVNEGENSAADSGTLVFDEIRVMQ